MARALHRPSRVPVPAWLVRLVLREQSALLLGSRRATPARALELGYDFRFESIEAAMDDVLR
jgi:NAD dependent epimerase/dehydratase family enzyme